MSPCYPPGTGGLPGRLRATRCRFLAGLAALARAPAWAQELPNPPIRVVVPFIAGSSLDARMRVIAATLSERLKQQVIVDNNPGAGNRAGPYVRVTATR